MTLPKSRQASNKIEKEQLIQDIRKINPDLSEKILNRYDIDDLRKIKMANTPQPNVGNTAGRPKMKYGGKMKKKYQSKGVVSTNYEEVKSQRDKDMALALRLAKLETEGSGGRKMSEQDIKYALHRIGSGFDTEPQKKARIEKIMKRISELESRGAVGKLPERTIHKVRVGDSWKYSYQQGGMADMSAAPMVQPRKKKKQSGFRTKYSKGGGVRAAKYKV